MPQLNAYISKELMDKLDRLASAMEQTTGFRVSRSAVVAAAIEAFSLSIRPVKSTEVLEKEHPADVSA